MRGIFFVIFSHKRSNMIKSHRFTNQENSPIQEIKNIFSNKTKSKRLRFLATDRDLIFLKSYKQNLEENLVVVNKILKLFEN